jgi:flavin reductase (DIM6/NTAB) family NADH-FMN oxidoreductase RutF
MRTLTYIIALAAIIGCSGNAQENQNEMNELKEVTWQELNDNVVRLIGKDWMLVTAGKIDDYNMMTASWGTMGWLWELPVSTIYVRPQRHTHNFTEREDYYTLAFFKEEHRDVLRTMGSVSGRNFDKINYEKLTAFETKNGSVGFEEAYLIIECRKLYSTVIQEEKFHDKSVMEDKYPRRDFHTMYIGEITGVWMRE